MARWWLMVAVLALAACGGGDPEPEEADPPRPVDCRTTPRPPACL